MITATGDRQGDSSDVAAEGGEVLVDGPHGVAISLSPQAARSTGEQLIAKAHEAELQRFGISSVANRP